MLCVSKRPFLLEATQYLGARGGGGEGARVIYTFNFCPPTPIPPYSFPFTSPPSLSSWGLDRLCIVQIDLTPGVTRQEGRTHRRGAQSCVNWAPSPKQKLRLKTWCPPRPYCDADAPNFFVSPKRKTFPTYQLRRAYTHIGRANRFLQILSDFFAPGVSIILLCIWKDLKEVSDV